MEHINHYGNRTNKHFAESGCFFLNDPPKMVHRSTIINKEGKDIPGFLGHELTEHIGDMEYEYWALANDYAMLMVQKYRK